MQLLGEAETIPPDAPLNLTMHSQQIDDYAESVDDEYNDRNYNEEIIDTQIYSLGPGTTNELPSLGAWSHPTNAGCDVKHRSNSSTRKIKTHQMHITQ